MATAVRAAAGTAQTGNPADADDQASLFRSMLHRVFSLGVASGDELATSAIRSGQSAGNNSRDATHYAGGHS
jgi:hypothetical protein